MTETAFDLERGTAWLGAALGLPPDAKPFPWQLELLRRLATGRHVEAIDVPTGLGKTAVMAIWLVARALGGALPRRLVYVVDRRAVVDQATDVAEGLRAWVARDAAVRAALGLLEKELPISTLRGQHVDNREWLNDPSLPAIVIGTVDMVGSRLLFSGYGVTPKMRSFHAGLLGTDSLIALDEAHLAQPFERLIEQIARGRDANERSLRPESSLDHLLPSFWSLSLSATGRARDPERVLGLTDADCLRGGTVDKRLRAPKRMWIRANVDRKELPEALAAEAWSLSGEGAAPVRVIVFCNSREHAQGVREALLKRSKGTELPEPVLFVGGRRVHERQAAAARLRELGFVAGTASRPERAAFVIATSAGEVGVDLDADHAVCDLVPWERMVQRLGRVNRRGEGDASIIVVSTDVDDEAEQARRDSALEVLAALPTTGGADPAIDVSLASLLSIKERATHDDGLRDLIGRATTPPPIHPPLTRALLEAWSMTSLEEHSGRPEVAPWIRGWPDDTEKPQTTLVWRHHLPVDATGALFPARDLDTFASSASPHLSERLETETWRVIEWLGQRVGQLRRAGSASASPSAAGLDQPSVLGVLLDRTDRPVTTLRDDELGADSRRRLERMLAGATLMLDRRVGGLSDGLLDEENDELVPDVTEVEPQVGARAVPFRVHRIAGDLPGRAPPGWRVEATIPIRLSDEEEPEWLLVESIIDSAAESEEGRSASRRAQLLDEHEEWAEREVRGIASRLSLPPDYAESLAAAARLHDEGKKASRWQRAFRVPSGGNPPYAKSATSNPNLALLEGYRHELGSLPHAEVHPRVNALGTELRELCLHVIAAHHGSARPIIRTAGAEEPPTRLALRAREIALRFSALEKRWGPWGLAWWEALLRSADQRASRRNDEIGGSDG